MPTFPGVLGGTVMSGLPYSRTEEFQTVAVETEGGCRYRDYRRATGKKRWHLAFSCTVAEAETLRAFYATCNGNRDLFEFTDPDSGVLYATCRFDMEAFSIEYPEPGLAICEVRIREQ